MVRGIKTGRVYFSHVGSARTGFCSLINSAHIKMNLIQNRVYSVHPGALCLFYPPPSPHSLVIREPDKSGNNIEASLSPQAMPSLTREWHFEKESNSRYNHEEEKHQKKRNINKIYHAPLRTTLR